MGDGTRTHDNRNHNPGLYQLSYTHQKLRILGLPGRDRTCDHLLRRQVLYPTELRADRTACFPVTGRGEEIRTPDILLPKQARYQTALHPGEDAFYTKPRKKQENTDRVQFFKRDAISLPMKASSAFL